MCNLYSVTTNVEALRALVKTFEIGQGIGNLEPQTGVFPDFVAPIIRNRDGIRELTKAARWGLPSSSRALYEAARTRAQEPQAKQGRDLTPEEFNDLVKMEPDRGTTNVRNVDSQHWKRWLGPEYRCIVPLNSFSEFDNTEKPGGGKMGTPGSPLMPTDRSRSLPASGFHNGPVFARSRKGLSERTCLPS